MALSRSRLRFAGAILCSGILAWMAIEWYASRQPVSGDFTEEISRRTGDVPEAIVNQPATGPIRLAIGPLGVGSTETEAAVADLLTAELSGNSSIHLVERREMTRILGEFHLNALGAVNPTEAVRLGRIVGADWFLLGARHGSGTNLAALIRIVDARSGILRDISIVPATGTASAQSAALAEFVRKGLESGAAKSGGTLFASIGGFEDMSLRPRHAGMESELRAHLGAALAKQGYTLLERQLTHDLFSELQLASLGFIDSTNPPPRFQTSVLLIDGIYQSFDTTGDEIEMTLRVTRIGGKRLLQNLRATAGASLLTSAEVAAAKMAVEVREAQRPPTRRGEVRAQVDLGMERSRLADADLDPRRWPMVFNRLRDLDTETMERRRTNLLEAIQSFESALLLDPHRSEAKLFLARCLVDPHVNRMEEARGLWRELAVLTNAGPAMRARISMGYSYLFDGKPKRAFEWMQGLLDAAETEEQKRYYSTHLDSMRWHVSHSQDRDAQPPEQHEEPLTRDIRQWLKALEAGTYDSLAGRVHTFMGGEGDLETKLEKLRHLFEQLAKDMPRAEPYLWATALREVRRTNDPIVAHFERTVTRVAEDPKTVLLPNKYFESMTIPMRWAFDKGHYGLNLKIAEALERARRTDPAVGSTEWWRFQMGCAYQVNQRWREALAEFEGITNKIIPAQYPGPWGGFPAVQVPTDYATYCRRQLGETNAVSSWDKQLKKSLWFSNTKPQFVADARQAWIVTPTAIIDLDPESASTKTNSLNLPFELEVTHLAQSENQLWIGTDGFGLLAYNKQTRQIRQYLEKDGLLFNSISALHFDGGQLWVGCANGKLGGLCRFDPATALFKSYAPSLTPAQTDPFSKDTNGPTRYPIRAIGAESGGRLWVGSESFGWQRANPEKGSWNWFQPFGRYGSPRATADSKEWFALGEAPSPMQVDDTHLLGLFDKQRGELIRLGIEAGLPYPAVTALCFDNDRLWIGGPGYLARLNLSTRNVEEYFLRSNTQVNTIQVVGDSMWLGFSRTIFRIPRPK